MNPVAASVYCTTVSLYASHCAESPLKLPLTMGAVDSKIHGCCWVNESLHSKRHLNRFSCFCSAHGFDQHSRPWVKQ